VKRFALCYQTVVYLSCPVCRALWPNGWTDPDETWHEGRLPPWPQCVRWGPSSPPPKGHSPPTIFGYPSPKGGPKFSAHVYCGQTAGWMKLVLGMEVGLSPCDFVLDGDPAPLPQKGAEPPCPIFGPFLLWPNGWMHQDSTWYGVGLSPGDFVLDGDPVPHTKRGRSPLLKFSVHVTWYGARPTPRRLCVRWGPRYPSPKGDPNFRPMFIVAKRPDVSRCHLARR